MCLFAVAGCSTPQESYSEHVPPDFSLAICIDPPGDESGGEIYVIDPSGTLRAATGPGCTLQTYPEPTTVLDSKQMYTLYQGANGLQYENSTGPELTTTRVEYRMVANGSVTHHTFLLPQSIRDQNTYDDYAIELNAVDLVQTLRDYAWIDPDRLETDD